jgi:autotransporter passenger strand-loop-strand repeat protein
VDVKAGGVARRVTVAASGMLIARAGATVINTVVNGGTEKVLAGATMRGTVRFGASGGGLAIAKQVVAATVAGFQGPDRIDLTAFRFGAGQTDSFVENADGTKGVLTVTDGARNARVTLFGQYVAAGFHFSKAGAGTAITYSGTTAAHVDLAAGHGV